ncbi:alpha-amylase-like isoform X1 [Tasmannia lanceolata]|uniref:alpha-amylase-like isoform X1 n=1 Tax=Tasmannia lanceolata TaxID=3420 RepID=UPI004062A9C2
MKAEMKRFKLLLCVCILSTQMVQFGFGQIVLQGFNWTSWSKHPGGWYRVLKDEVTQLASAGVTHVWLPPPSHTTDPEGYMPGRLYDLDASNYGTEADLKDLILALHNSGLKAMADIVINHRVGTILTSDGGCTFEGGTTDGRLDWGTWAVCKNDPNFHCGTGNDDTGLDFFKAPDIDHTNPTVQTDLINWLNWLKTNIGFDGWRLDTANGYGGPYIKLYMEGTKPDLAIGEVYTLFDESDGKPELNPVTNPANNRQELINWLQSVGDVPTTFDFTTKGLLNAAVNGQLSKLNDTNGKPPGLIGYIPAKAVTLVDNHDTIRNTKWAFPADKVMLGYAYILTHPGIPSIFYDHFFDWGFTTEMKNLIAIRARNGINPTSSCRIVAAEDGLYMAIINEKIMVKIGPNGDLHNLLTPDFNNTPATAGINYAVWEKA